MQVASSPEAAGSSNRPGAEQIQVALSALRDDAGRWDRMAETLRGAAGDAAGLGPDPSAFSFAGQEAAQAHEGLRVLPVPLGPGPGAANSADVAAALRTSADVYAAEETAGVHRLHGIY